jgi:asparagine synthase (glutamine-hydrolysing)
MCGIAGLAGFVPPVGAPERVGRMLETLSHRGPDGSGLWSDELVCLGHRRLVVLDKAGGDQPMRGEGGCVITFNGEIYNHADLRAELSKEGHRFRTRSDTEVLLALWERHGEAGLARLNGMFAFALWDPAAGELVLVRDRLGKKPLYYVHQNGRFGFASEPGGLVRHGPWESGIGAIDLQALSDYLSMGYILTPKSIYRGVRRLPAAGIARFNPRNGALSISEYWSLADAAGDSRMPYDGKAREQFVWLLQDAVRLRLQADVPVGLFVSGGLDSSAIAATAAQLGTDNLSSFTVSFTERSFDEAAYGRMLAAQQRLKHVPVPYQAPTPVDLSRLAASLGEPFADTSVIPMMQLCGAARRDVTVALTGDGADELLAGYPTYRADQIFAAWRHIPMPVRSGLNRLASSLLRPSYRKVSFDYKLRRFLSGPAHDRARAHYWWRTIFSEREKEAVLDPAALRELGGYDPFDSYARHFEPVRGLPFLEQCLYVDAKTWLQDDILVKADRASMMHGLELRSPFLDHRLVEFSARLDGRAKMAGLRQKVILSDCMKGILPPEILGRRKQGFNAPSLNPPGQWVRPDPGFPLLRQDFALDSQREDVTFKQFSLEMLASWWTSVERWDQVDGAV